MQGTIVSETKQELSDMEFSVLKTAIKFESFNANDIKLALGWEDDIPAIRSLSTLRGMDLLLSDNTSPELKNKNTMEFSNRKRRYSCPHGTIQRRRVEYVLKGGLGFLKKSMLFGTDLWPNRPKSHIQMKGVVKQRDNGVIILELDSTKRFELQDLINRQVDINLDLI